MTGPKRSAALVALPGAEDLAAGLAECLGQARAALEYRRFPDGESYLRLDGDVGGLEVVLVARLDRPDDRIPALLFAADLVRELGAKRLGLVCPYLPYMRQDCRFRPGEAVTSRTFADLLSARFDWLVTIDPHLHRYASLDEIYALDSTVVAAAPALGQWIAAAVDRPLLIGPDGESEQWVGAVAAGQGLPARVFGKHRHGDREVRLTLPDLSGLERHTPVLLDDIISSGTTMAEAARRLIGAGFPAPLAVGVHGLFAEGAREAMQAAGIRRIVCTNTVESPESAIDLTPELAEAVARRLAN